MREMFGCLLIVADPMPTGVGYVSSQPKGFVSSSNNSRIGNRYQFATPAIERSVEGSRQGLGPCLAITITPPVSRKTTVRLTPTRSRASAGNHQPISGSNQYRMSSPHIGQAVKVLGSGGSSCWSSSYRSGWSCGCVVHEWSRLLMN